MKVGRNEPCPCGSGKKYKRCCQGKVSSLEVERRKLKVIRREMAAAERRARIATASVVKLRELQRLRREAIAISAGLLDSLGRRPNSKP